MTTKLLAWKNNLKFLKEYLLTLFSKKENMTQASSKKNVDTLINKDKVTVFDKVSAVICRNHNKCK